MYILLLHSISSLLIYTIYGSSLLLIYIEKQEEEDNHKMPISCVKGPMSWVQ